MDGSEKPPNFTCSHYCTKGNLTCVRPLHSVNHYPSSVKDAALQRKWKTRDRPGKFPLTEFTDLIYDGTVIVCETFAKLLFENKNDCHRFVNSPKYIETKELTYV